MIKRVHLVFKTHLDIGFTDLAAATIERYRTRFIPHAIETARLLKERGGEERLVWVTGAWLIYFYLQQAGEEERRRLEQSIREGDISWHAFPFTTHTELMSKPLAEYALSLSASLDKRFSHTTIAAKMTDVPGHTLALVPLLVKAGVSFLHLGVNGGSPVPDVPPLFRWRAPTGEELLVQYDATYGSRQPLEGMEDVLVIETSPDNSGPPSAAEVCAVYKRLHEEFPGARILASDLSSYAEAVLRRASDFPLVTQEIGDTWIHGVGSDPAKVAGYRLLLALGERWEKEGKLPSSSPAYDAFMGALLMVPEHTWGLDFKKYLADYKNWSVEDFTKARKQDRVGSEAIPRSYQFIEEFAKREYEHIFPENPGRRTLRSYSFFESSHQEQRAYLDQAVSALPHPLQEEVTVARRALIPVPFTIGDTGRQIVPDQPFVLGETTLSFSSDGSLSSVVDGTLGELVGEEGIGVYRYETFSSDSYQSWHHSYNRDFEQGKDWILADFGKPGMECAVPPAEQRLYAPVLDQLSLIQTEQGFEVVACLSATPQTPLGAPRKLTLRYRFTPQGRLVEVCLDWFRKQATRLPEALWLSLGLKLTESGRWKMLKLGLPLPLDTTVSRGARSVHAVEGLEYVRTRPVLILRNLDSPLVSVGQRKLLKFDDRPALVNGLFHFNLSNNLWGTNFPLWYGEDGRSRIVLDWKD